MSQTSGASGRRSFWSQSVQPSGPTVDEVDGGWTVVERKPRGKSAEKEAGGGASALHEMRGHLASAALMSKASQSAASALHSNSSPDRLTREPLSYSAAIIGNSARNVSDGSLSSAEEGSRSPIFTSRKLNKNQLNRFADCSTPPPNKGKVTFAASVFSPPPRTRHRSLTRPPLCSLNNSYPVKRSSAHFSNPIDRADSSPINSIPLDFDRPGHLRQAEYDEWNAKFMQEHPEHQLETRCYPHYCPNKYRLLKCACISCEPHHLDHVIVHGLAGNVRQFSGSPSLDSRSRRRRNSGHLARDFTPPVTQRLSDADFYTPENLSKISVEDFVQRNGMVLTRAQIQELPKVHCLLARKGDAYSFADLLKLPPVAQMVLFIKLLKAYTDASCAPVIRNSAPLVIPQGSCPVGMEVLSVPTNRQPPFEQHKICRPWIPVRQRGYPNEEIYDGLMQRSGVPDADTQAYLVSAKQSKGSGSGSSHHQQCFKAVMMDCESSAFLLFCNYYRHEFEKIAGRRLETFAHLSAVARVYWEGCSKARRFWCSEEQRQMRGESANSPAAIDTPDFTTAPPPDQWPPSRGTDSDEDYEFI